MVNRRTGIDKLRAIEYFARVVETGSFAAAARALEVSPPAVTKLIAALERDLGTVLLHRDSRRVVLTADGQSYLQACMPVLDDLRAAEARLASNRIVASGRLVVGMSRVLGANVLMPYLPELLRRHPGMELDFRVVHYPQEPQASLCDLLLLIGWAEDPDWVLRTIGWTRVCIAAAPQYWHEQGVPRDPDDLKLHRCVAYRLPRGLVYDRWKFERGEESRSVAVTPYLVADDRDALQQAVVSGAGVLWAGDLTVHELVRRGLLQPVLRDWVGLEAPPIRLHYRRGARNSAKVRAFADFARQVVERLEAQRPGPAAAFAAAQAAPPTPDWFSADRTGALAAKEREAGSKRAVRTSRWTGER